MRMYDGEEGIEGEPVVSAAVRSVLNTVAPMADIDARQQMAWVFFPVFSRIQISHLMSAKFHGGASGRSLLILLCWHLTWLREAIQLCAFPL